MSVREREVKKEQKPSEVSKVIDKATRGIRTFTRRYTETGYLPLYCDLLLALEAIFNIIIE